LKEVRLVTDAPGDAAFEEHAQNGSRPRHLSGKLLDLVAARDSALCASYDVEEVWEHSGELVFKFRGVDSISAAEKLRGAEVQVPRSERVELEPGEYFHSDLIGCEVRERASGRTVGRVTNFEEYGGPPLLEIDGGRVLIPFVKAICVDIRPDEKLIRVDIPEGLENLQSA
jgi:16S rRNA processing protein RimM